MLVVVQYSQGQVEEKLLEILEGYNDLSESELGFLIEEVEDSLFALDLGRDTFKFQRRYRSPVRASMISTYWRNIEKADGSLLTYDEGGFEGPSYGVKSRLQIRSRDFSIKAIAESDPGEISFREPDYRSAGIAVTPRGEDFGLYFGDYHVEAGMGLGLATRPRFNSWKSDPHMQLKQKTRIGLHGGSDENRFFRGGAAEYHISRLSARVFVSAKDLDVNLQEEELGAVYFSGVYATGLHRTALEKEKKDAVYEEVGGLVLEYSGGRFEVGSLVAAFKFSDDFKLPSPDTWPLSDPKLSNDASRFSLWGRSLMGKGMVLGEYAISSTGGSAMNIAYSRFYGKGLTYMMFFERTGKYFFSHNTAVSSSIVTKKASQQGRINLLYQPRRSWGIQSDISIEGIEAPALEDHGPSYKFRLRVFYDLDFVEGETLIHIDPGKSMGSLKVKAKEADGVFFWQGEIGFSAPELLGLIECPGSYLSLRARLRTVNKNLTIQGGLSFFTSQEGSGVFYTYEPDVLYGMSLPALSGTGVRSFILLKYTPLESLSLECKVSRVDYSDRDEIGAGRDGIPFGHRTSFKVQVVYRASR